MRVLVALALFAAPHLALAGRIDYSKLSDQALRDLNFFNAALILVITAIGIIGWLRYRRTYVPAPGRFTPARALLLVGAIVAAVLVLAAVKLA